MSEKIEINQAVYYHVKYINYCNLGLIVFLEETFLEARLVNFFDSTTTTKISDDWNIYIHSKCLIIMMTKTMSAKQIRFDSIRARKKRKRAKKSINCDRKRVESNSNSYLSS